MAAWRKAKLVGRPIRAGWRLAGPADTAEMHEVDLAGKVGMLRAVRIEELAPCAPGRRAARADAIREVLVDAIGNEELRLFGPSVGTLGERDLIVPERLAVGRGGVL